MNHVSFRSVLLASLALSVGLLFSSCTIDEGASQASTSSSSATKKKSSSEEKSWSEKREEAREQREKERAIADAEKKKLLAQKEKVEKEKARKAAAEKEKAAAEKKLLAEKREKEAAEKAAAEKAAREKRLAAKEEAEKEKEAARLAAKKKAEEERKARQLARQQRDSESSSREVAAVAQRSRGGGFFSRMAIGTPSQYKSEGHHISVNQHLLGSLNPSNAKIEIDLSEQRARIYKTGAGGRQLVIETSISSGKSGHSTPTGSYRIKEKMVHKRSTLYGTWMNSSGATVRSSGDSRQRPYGASRFVGAEMPYWMRINGGIGMHIGYVPNYPASHGCIRVPSAIQPLIYSKVGVGTSVTIKS